MQIEYSISRSLYYLLNVKGVVVRGWEVKNYSGVYYFDFGGPALVNLAGKDLISNGLDKLNLIGCCYYFSNGFLNKEDMNISLYSYLYKWSLWMFWISFFKGMKYAVGKLLNITGGGYSVLLDQGIVGFLPRSYLSSSSIISGFTVNYFVCEILSYQLSYNNVVVRPCFSLGISFNNFHKIVELKSFLYL